MMKYLINILLPFLAFAAPAQNRSTVSNARLSSSINIKNYGHGLTYWNGINPWSNLANQGVIDTVWQNGAKAAAKNGAESYVRLEWYQLESTQGTYTFGPDVFPNLDYWINRAIDSNQTFSFGIMPAADNGSNLLAGVVISYPSYLHTLMQAEAVKDTVYSNDNMWIPNWNSPNFLNRWDSLNKAIANHIATASYNGVAYSKVVRYIDIRTYGNFGEWHEYPWYTLEPAARQPTNATFYRMMNSYVNYFPNLPLVVPIGAYDPGNASRIPLTVIDSIIKLKNTWGNTGYRRDHMGDMNGDTAITGSRTEIVGTDTLSKMIMRLWKTAIITGEPNNGGVPSNLDSNGGGAAKYYFSLPKEVLYHHVESFGNGNFSIMSQGLINNFISGAASSGARITYDSIKVEQVIFSGKPFTVAAYWNNIGLTPCYDNWTVKYQLKRYSDDSLLATYTSTFNPKLFLPTTSSQLVTETFTAPVYAGLLNGYRLTVIIVDPNGYRKPLSLAMLNPAQNADGSYTIVTNDGNFYIFK